jgi:hypothetical protein
MKNLRNNWVIVCLLLPICTMLSLGKATGQSAGDFFTSEKYRIELLVPDHNLTLAQENEVGVVVHAPGLAQLSGYQIPYWDGQLEIGGDVEGSHKVMPILRHADGSTYIKVVPMRLERSGSGC